MSFLIENQTIKDLYLVQSRDQGKYSSIKTLDSGHKWFYRFYESDYPWSYSSVMDICTEKGLNLILKFFLLMTRAPLLSMRTIGQYTGNTIKPKYFCHTKYNLETP